MELLQSVQATSEVAHIRCTGVEPKGLSDADILLNGRVQEGGIDIETPKLEIVSNCNTKEDAKTRKANDMRECLL
jgi:hypothetical protein